jgi:hypothetical protein
MAPAWPLWGSLAQLGRSSCRCLCNASSTMQSQVLARNLTMQLTQVIKERNFPYSSLKMLASARWVARCCCTRQPKQQQQLHTSDVSGSVHMCFGHHLVVHIARVATSNPCKAGQKELTTPPGVPCVLVLHTQQQPAA